MNRSLGNSAMFEIAGEVSTNVTWDQPIYFTEQGQGMDLTDLAFELQFRCDESDTSAARTLSTASGELVVEDDNLGNPTVLAITVPNMTGLEGDYIADLVSRDLDGKLTHWAHGVLTFRPSPLAF